MGLVADEHDTPGLGPSRAEGAPQSETKGEWIFPICPRCVVREAVAYRLDGSVPPASAWPLGVDAIVKEERRVLEFERDSGATLALFWPGIAAEWIGNGIEVFDKVRSAEPW